MTSNPDPSKKFPSLLVITANGYGKHTFLEEYRMTKRGGKGIKTLNLTKKIGNPVLIQLMTGEEQTLIITTKNGITINLKPEDIPQLGRATQGVKVIKLEANDSVISAGIN
jgi:DNA gyrase subunit A